LHDNRAQLNRIDELAADIGRLRRRLDPESSSYWLGERIANHVESLDAMLRPSAGELVAWTAPGNHDAITAALQAVDNDRRRIQALLGAKP